MRPGRAKSTQRCPILKQPVCEECDVFRGGQSAPSEVLENRVQDWVLVGEVVGGTAGNDISSPDGFSNADAGEPGGAQRQRSRWLSHRSNSQAACGLPRPGTAVSWGAEQGRFKPRRGGRAVRHDYPTSSEACGVGCLGVIGSIPVWPACKATRFARRPHGTVRL